MHCTMQYMYLYTDSLFFCALTLSFTDLIDTKTDITVVTSAED